MRRVTLAAATRVWARIGWLSFGGPAGQIALMHRELVERRRWVSDARFLHALNYCMLLPGPEAQQLAIYLGWLMHRTAGGVIAGVLFVIPGALVMLVLSALYVAYRQLPPVTAVFLGLKAAVLAIVVEAVVRIGRRTLRNRALASIAAAFVSIFFLRVPFPWVIVGAALLGIAGSRWRPRDFPDPKPAAELAAGEYLIDQQLLRGELGHVTVSLTRSITVTGICLALWVVPVLAVTAIFGTSSVFAQQGLFFGQAALVTFGGAYAVLAYLAQRAVESYRWLSAGEMLDGLALAETTPGPLIMVVQYVAFLAAFRNPHGLPPMYAGVLGSMLTVWVTFVPCFMWIFAGAPYVEALRSNRLLHAMLSAVGAAVVGVILNVSAWFSVHTLFRTLEHHAFGILHVDVPVVSSIDPASLLITAAALLAMLRYKVGFGWTLIGSAIAGLAWVTAGGH